MRSLWEIEIIEIHEFFEEWFQGTLPDTPEVFERLEGILHSG
ncbi:hypothetical protein [Jeotgalibacillus soli]|uniref:Uncharacterized protein n=1 Tax=Jeotgalibacillus soli TaxID=889306 RepID=A0A0C2S6A1_9BACL|nr:hypothetical protein [Jeotgalibacillus soli]KIL49539.1 hypothetical protein KP78_10070 [Jeotgalibacillus soli]